MASRHRADAVEKLDGTNFDPWKFQLMLALKVNGLWEVVNGDKPKPAADAVGFGAWVKEDSEAMCIISTTVDRTQIHRLYDCQSSKAMFDTLVRANSDSSVLNQQHTLQKFLSFKLRPNQSPVRGMEELEQLAASLEAMGNKQSDENIITRVIMSLPRDYAAFRTAWGSTAAADRTREKLFARLKQEEVSLQQYAKDDDEEQQQKSVAFRFQGHHHRKDDRKGGRPEKKVTSKDMSDVQCFNCKKFGHYKRNCKNPKAEEDNAQRQFNQRPKGQGKYDRSGRAFMVKFVNPVDVSGIASFQTPEAKPLSVSHQKHHLVEATPIEEQMYESDDSSQATHHESSDDDDEWEPIQAKQAIEHRVEDSTLAMHACTDGSDAEFSDEEQPQEHSDSEEEAFFDYAYSSRVGPNFDRKDEWVSDSGATHHVCGDKAWFSSFERFADGEGPTVQLADNMTVVPPGKGEVAVTSLINDKWVERQLKDVYYIPGGANLFSEIKMAQNDFTILRNKEATYFWDELENQPGPVAKYDGSAYVMQFRPTKTVPIFHAKMGKFMPNKLCARVWHKRLCHSSNWATRETARRKAVRGLELEEVNDDVPCTDCEVGKQPRQPFPRVTTEDNWQPGEKIYADLAGKFTPPSLGGANYYLLIKDHASNFRRVNFLKTKSETNGYLKEFIAFIERKTGTLVKEFHSDNGGEFVNGQLKSYFREKGISHIRSAPRCPQSNGKIERDMRTVKDAARTMLHAAGLPKSLWAEAVNTAVYAFNRILSKQTPTMTPYEAIYAKKPSVAHMRVFGCTAYAHDDHPTRTTLDELSKRMVMVGYSDRDRVYRLYDEDEGEVFERRHVNFYEEQPEVVWINYKESQSNKAQPQQQVPEPQSPRRKIIPDPIPDEVSSEDEFVSPPSSPKMPEPVAQSSKKTSATPGPQPQTHDIRFTQDGKHYVATVPVGQSTIVKIPNNPKKTKEKIPTTPHQKKLRDRDNLQKPVRFQSAQVVTEPATYNQALKSPEKDAWKVAMQQEIESQELNNSWEVVDNPRNVKLLDTKWVFKLKKNPDGSIARYKARLVIRGYLQEYGVDYDETFSSVVRYESIRLLLSLAVSHKLYIEQFDVKTAFLHGTLKEEIYVQIPKGYTVNGDNKVLKLLKSIYGLKQSPRCWLETITAFLKSVGLTALPKEPCVFVGTFNGAKIICAIYVDDGLVLSESKKSVTEFLDTMSKSFELTRGPPTTYVGLEITRDGERGSISISQQQYTQTLLERFNMEDCHPVKVPMQPYTKLQIPEEIRSDLPYRQLVGSLLFLAKCTRPDISYSVSKLAQFSSGYDETHWTAGKCVLRYLKGTTDFAIHYDEGEDDELVGFTDAGYAGCELTSKSHTGVVFKKKGGPVSWKSRLQGCVAQSSCESEFMAMNDGANEAVFLNELQETLGFPQPGPVRMKADNQSAIKWVKNPESHGKNKHVRTKYHKVKEYEENKEIATEYVHTSEQLADFLTKPLSRQKFETNRDAVGVRPLKSNPDKTDKLRLGMSSVQGKRRSAMMFNLLPITLAMCVFGQFANAREDNNVPHVFWTKSEVPVTTGYYQVGAEITFVDPCAIMTDNNIHHDLVKAAYERCQYEYQTNVMEELKKMCPQRRWTQLTVRRRRKRVVGILAGLLIIAVVAALGVSLTGAAIAINDHSRISTLESRQQEISTSLNSLEQQIKLNYDAIKNLTSKFNAAMLGIGELDADFSEMKGKFIDSSFAISYVSNRFFYGKSVILEASRLWKQGKVSPAFLQFFNITPSCGEDCPLELATAEKCGVSPDGTKLYLEFKAPIKSSDLNLVEADPFYFMTRKENQTCKIKYTGPKNAILSEKQDCVYAVNLEHTRRDKTLLAPARGCLQRFDTLNDTNHYAIEHCERRQPRDELKYVQVKEQEGNFYLYCPGSNLTVEGHTRTCPDDVMMLPARTKFSVNGVEYSGRNMVIIKKDELNPIYTAKVNWHLQPKANWTSLQMDVGALGTFKEVPPLDFHVTNNYWSTIGLAIAVILLIIVIILMYRRSNKPMQVQVTATPYRGSEMMAIEN